jgi:hypothetical protein
MNALSRHGKPMGMETVLTRVRTRFPELKFGHFNPPKEAFS